MPTVTARTSNPAGQNLPAYTHRFFTKPELLAYPHCHIGRDAVQIACHFLLECLYLALPVQRRLYASYGAPGCQGPSQLRISWQQGPQRSLGVARVTKTLPCSGRASTVVRGVPLSTVTTLTIVTPQRCLPRPESRGTAVASCIFSAIRSRLPAARRCPVWRLLRRCGPEDAMNSGHAPVLRRLQNLHAGHVGTGAVVCRTFPPCLP